MADLEGLVATLAPGQVITAAESVEAYRRDASNDARAGTPAVVVRAESREDVQAALRWAHGEGIPVVPRGAGTGLSGGASAVDGCLVLSLERMTTLEIDPESQTAVCAPGVLNGQVKDAAREFGLWYPPDPSSYQISSIGGNIATNAGGLCCVKYGVTTDYVLGLDVVLADGTFIELGGKRIKDVAGLPILKLFVGAEGTLGVVTRAVLRLIPLAPAPATLVAIFPTVAQAADAVVETKARLRPAMLELMDHATINAVEDRFAMGLDRDAGALLVARSDVAGDERPREMSAMQSACEGAGASEVFVTDDPDEGEMFVEARRRALDAVEARGSLLLEDVGVAVPRLPELLRAIEGIAADLGVEIPTVAHAGDGNAHPLIVFDPADDDSQRRAQEAFNRVMDTAIGLGGTITGEHGVGRAKRDALARQLTPDTLAVMRRVKQALDPRGILNPGALL